MSHCLAVMVFIMAAVVLCEKVRRELCEHCSVRFGDLLHFLLVKYCRISMFLVLRNVTLVQDL